jgi:pimeloyl-ACP methyl ester carboxylesterase
MIHGTTVDRTRWGGVVGKLAEHFTLHLVDRRGRGDSGDGPSYHIEREFEDVVAVVESLVEPAFVFGHSYGAICSLEAARLTSLVLPSFCSTSRRYPFPVSHTFLSPTSASGWNASLPPATGTRL